MPVVDYPHYLRSERGERGLDFGENGRDGSLRGKLIQVRNYTKDAFTQGWVYPRVFEFTDLICFYRGCVLILELNFLQVLDSRSLIIFFFIQNNNNNNFGFDTKLGVVQYKDLKKSKSSQTLKDENFKSGLGL